VFDLSGDSAMSTSINCAMELSILYHLYIEGSSGLVLMVLNDSDIVPNDMPNLAAMLRAKSEDQEGQVGLFEKAYAKCYAFLQSHDAVTTGLHEISHAWMHDFETAGGGRKGVRRFSKALEGAHPGGNSPGNSTFSKRISQQGVKAEYTANPMKQVL
jgi:hypothetical protein